MPFIPILIDIVISIGLGVVSRLLAPKPKTGSTAPKGRDLTVNDPDAPWQILYGELVVGGSLFAIEMAGTNNEFLYVGIVWGYGGPDGIEAIEEIWFGDEVAVTGTTPLSKYTGLITAEHHLGTDAQTASSLLTGLAGGRFVAADKGSGHAYTVLKLKFDADKFSDFSIGNIRAKLKGRKVLDPRTGAVAWTQNPVLCARDYLSSARFGLAYGQGARTLPIILDEAYNNTQASVCDELVSRKAGGTRARYALNLAFSTDSEPGQVLLEMQAAMGGGIGYGNGKWRLHAGAWRPPEVRLDDGGLRGPVTIQMATGKLESANAVRGTFLDPTHWQPTNYPPYGPAAALAEDGGIRVWKELSFAGVTDAGQAQQLANLELERTRRPLHIVLPCKFLAYEVAAGDRFCFTHDDWVEKPFYVERVELGTETDAADGLVLGVDLTAREDDAFAYGWNAAVDEGDYAVPPSGNFPTPGHSLAVYPNSDPTAPPVPPGVHTSYRPLTNPLAGHDAGSGVATVPVASFTMRVGASDIPITGSTVGSLLNATLYYISYDDPTLAGGAVTFIASTTREDALAGAGRFFVGSVTTPAAGAPDTVGNNDGGTGAQIGGHIVRFPQAEAGGGTNTNPGAAIDGDWTTYELWSLTGTASPDGSALLSSLGSALETFYPKNVVLTVKSAVLAAYLPSSANAGTTITSFIEYTKNGGSSWTTIRTATGTGPGAAALISLGTDVVSLPGGTLPAGVQIRLRVTHSGVLGATTDAAHTLEIYEASYACDT